MADGPALKWRMVDVESLSPDGRVLAAALELAVPAQWSRLGRDGNLLWGECRSSASRRPQLYRVAADLTPEKPSASGLHCSCPSRKRPCKHALGLLFLAGLESFESGAPGADPVEWVRAARGPKRAESPGKGRGVQSEPGAKGPSLKRENSRRAADRMARVRTGLAHLERWMSDLLQTGLAGLAAAPDSFQEDCERIASLLVDHQASGLARRLRRLAGSRPAVGRPIGSEGSGAAGWPELLLGEFAALQLAIESFHSIHRLSEAEQSDLRAFIGWSRRREEALATPEIIDRWLVLGSVLEREPPLLVSRTWLTGLGTGRSALLLDHVPEMSVRPVPPIQIESRRPGTVLSGGLHFFPSGSPLRALPGALIESRRGGTPPKQEVEAALRHFAVALAGNPWLDLHPTLLAGVVPARSGDRWWVVDLQGAALPLSVAGRAEMTGWRLLALGGAAPLDLFGEWDGCSFRPLTALVGRRLVVLPA